MKTQVCPVTYNGQTYKSLKEFALQNNLNYSRVLAWHKKGKTPDEIVGLCQFSAASKETREFTDGPKRYLIEYNGVQYTSLYAAASALGLSPSRLYDIKKKQNLSAEAAIEYALEHLTKAGKGTSPNAAPCVVEGISYPSREAAIQAYNIPRITVYSRMEREGISFEEALIRGRDSSVYRTPAVTSFFNFRLIPMKTVLTTPILKDLMKSLTYYHFKTEQKQDLMSNQEVLLVNKASYVFYNKEARGIEIISELPFQIDELDTINTLNGTFIVTKVFTHPLTGRLYLSAFQSAKDELQDIKTLLNTWFSYSTIRDKLIRTFGIDNDRDQTTTESNKAVAAMAEQQIKIG